MIFLLHPSMTFIALIAVPLALAFLAFLLLSSNTVVDITLAPTGHAQGQLFLSAVLTSLFLSESQLLLNAWHRLLQGDGEVEVDIFTAFWLAEISVFLVEGVISCEGVELWAVSVMLFSGKCAATVAGVVVRILGVVLCVNIVVYFVLCVVGASQPCIR